MDTVQYIRFKHQQKLNAETKVRQSQDGLNQKLNHQTGAGLGNGYAPDMRDALRRVNEFDYQPTEDEIHFRRKFFGQYLDSPPPHQK